MTMGCGIWILSLKKNRETEDPQNNAMIFQPRNKSP
jgi:hypothetical protein